MIRMVGINHRKVSDNGHKIVQSLGSLMYNELGVYCESNEEHCGFEHRSDTVGQLVRLLLKLKNFLVARTSIYSLNYTCEST